jgi:protein-tyrosine phosphatase
VASSRPEAGRLLDWDGLFNARELGGLPLRGGGRTAPGWLVRSDSLAGLSAHGRDALAAYGVRTVVDLRSPAELASHPNPYQASPAGIRLLHRPLLDDADMVAVAGRPQEDVYRFAVDQRARRLAGILVALADAEPVALYHCHSGKDRTGIVTGLLLELAGVERAAIVADYAVSEHLLAPIYARWVAQEPDADLRRLLRQTFPSPPGLMSGLLQHLDQAHGGAERYLLAAGLSPDRLERLRARLGGWAAGVIR